MAKISQKKLDEFLEETRRNLSAGREESEPKVRQNDVDEFLTAFRSDLEASYTQEERDQMKAARAASLRPGETRRSQKSAVQTNRTDGWNERYSRIRSNADYGEKSQFRSTKRGEPVYNALLNSYTDSGYGDALYDYINGDRKAAEVLRNRMREGDPLSVTTDLSFVESMTDEERADYNYIHATEGAKQAERYLTYLREDLNRRQRESEETKLKEYAEAHPVKATIESIATAPLKGLTYAGQAAEAISGGELDPNASYNRFAYAPNTIRSTVSDRIEEKWGKAGSFGYNVAMSMADFLTASGMSGGSGLSMAIMGSGAAADAALDALDRGIDGNRALALGAVAGAAEYLTEKFSVEQLFQTSWTENALKYVLKNVFTEAGEESASAIVNTIADVLISGDKSEWQQMVLAYKEQGFSDKEALKKTFWEHMKMLGLDALGGAISGGLMAGGGAAVGAIGMGAMNRENIRSEQEAVRAAVNEQRREIRDSVADPDTLTPERETFETGAEVRRDQLMTLDEEDLANRIENAEDETEATAIKYGATDKQLKQVRELSDITGREVVFFRQKSENGKVRNGYYNPNDGRIYVNVNASRSKTTPMVVAHEITHTLEGTEAYRDLNALVMADIRRSGRDPEQMREDKRKMYAQAGVTLADEGAIDSEIVAEEAERFLGNVRAIAEVFREKQSLGRTIASALDRMLIRATGTSEEMYISRAARLYERAEELADSAETEINRRLDEREAAQAEAAPAAPQNSAPVQTAETPTVPKLAPEEPQKSSETVSERRTVPQTGGTVPGGTEARSSGTETQEAARTSMDESARADMMLDELNQRYEDGEISDEEYDEAYELIEESRMTGRGIESSADIVDNVEGKIPRGIRNTAISIDRKARKVFGMKKKKYRYSISEDTLDDGKAEVVDGVAVARNIADIMKNGGYSKPKDYMVQYSISTTPAWEKNYLATNKDEDARSVVDAVRMFTDKMVMDDAVRGYVPMGNYKPAKMGPLRKNVEYIWTFDMDTSCPRTFQFLHFRDAIQKKAGRYLTYNESINLLELMRAYGQQIPCCYCYVENKRVLLSSSYNKFFDFRDAVMRAPTYEQAEKVIYGYSEGKELPDASRKALDRWRSDTSYNPTVTEVWTATNTARNSVLNFLDEKLEQGIVSAKTAASRLARMVLDEFGIRDKGAAAEIRNFVKDWVYDTQANIPHIYNTDNNPSVSAVDERALALNHEALAYSKSASSAKSVENYIPYTDQLKNVSAKDKEYIIGMGGIRKHSSNDFRMDYVQDYILFYADLAAGKWTGHTYSKSSDFVKVFASTGDRINMSVAFYEDGDGNLRENIDEGASWKDAKELREAYDNVGAMAMVTSDNQLSYALNADWIDMIIPFHASGLDKSVWYNLRMWNDYTTKQSERFYNADTMREKLTAAGVDVPKVANAAQVKSLFEETFRIKHIYGKNGEILKPHFFPGDTYVNGQRVPGHHNNVDTYFELCEEYGVHPRFYGIQVTDKNGNQIEITEHPAYLKLIKETARTDTPQETIKFNFGRYDEYLKMTPFEYAMQRLREEALNGGFDNTREDPYGVVNEFISEYLGKDRPLGYLTDRAKTTREILLEASKETEKQQEKIVDKIRADEGNVQWSVSAEEIAQPTENAMLVDRYAGMEGQNNIFRDLLWRHNQRMVDAIVAHRRQTKTEKFREWFGKSTVINNDGEPMVVFRGTSATTAKLDHNDKPIWFSNNVMYAKAYSDEVTLQDKFRMSSRIFGGSEMKIIPAYLRAVNPADFGDTDGSFVEKLSELSRNLMIPEDELREVWDKTGRQETVWKTLHTTEMKNLLSSYGYDSVKAVEYGVDTWGVFSGSQVKSAIANNGKFNPNRSDIRYSVSEDEDTTPYGSLPVKAQNRVRDLERKFGIAVDKMFGLGMTYKSPDFRAFLSSNVRPLVNAYLENGIIPEEESDALFAQFFDPATGTDEALQKQEFYNAFEEMEEGLFNVARWSQSQTAVPETDREETPISTTEEAEQLFAAQRDARREMDKVMYRVLLKPEDEVTVGKLIRGELSPDQVTENRADILEAYRVQKAFRDADAAVSVYKKRLKAELYKHVDKYLGNIAQWKDKRMPLMYQRETMERNIRDIIPDKAEADAFIAEFITPVHRAEAQRQRFLGEYRERVKKLNLSTKVQEGNQQSEAYAVQFLGEAADNIRILSLSGKIDQQRDGHTLEEWEAAVEAFWAANPNMDRAKIDSAIGEFRQIYNELLPKLNEVRIRNGYAPVAFRRGYFPHFTATSEDTVLAKILRPFGIEFNADALPTSINGLTADFKPGITYFQFGNERLGFETTYDALQGYEMYLNAASDVIYHTDNIQKLRALAARIRYLTGDEGIKQQIDKVKNNDTLDEAEKQVQLEEIYRKGRYRMSNFVVTMDEYTNGLANKKSRFDRGVEELFGRPAYSVMKALESRVAANMIAGNIGSALTNIIPLNQANAIIGNVNVLKGMYHTIHGMAVHDGFAAASDFLTNRRGADPLVRTAGQKVSDAASIPMNLIDGFVSETIVRAAYAKNLADGMGEDLALQHADALAASIMADRSKGALPVLFNARNPLMKLFTQFQVEVNNEYSVIFKDIPELAKANSETKAGAIARITGMLFRYFVGAWLFNELYEKLFGRRAALDPVGMIANTVGSVAEGEDIGKALQTLGNEAVESLPFVGGVLGGGRVPIQSAIPDFADLTMAATSDTWTGEKKALTAFEELSKPAAYLLPPFLGGQINKTLRGIAAAAQGGVYGIEGDEDGGAYLKYPVYDDPLDVTRSVLFGTTYTEGGQEWVDSGFKSLSVSQTAAYQAMKEFGADDRAAFDLIEEYKSVPTGEGRTAAQRDVIRTADIPGEAKFAAYYNLGASDSRKELMDSIEATEPRGKLGEAAQVLMDISDIGSGKTAGTCDLLAQSGLSEDTKQLIYRKEVSDQKDDDIRAAELVGISFDEYLDAHAAYSTLYNDKTLSKSEQALEFSRYVDNTNLTAMQKDTLRDIFKFYSQIPVQAKNYNELRNLGISDDYAAKITRAIDALEPLPGKKSVSDVQKARVVVDAVSGPDERLAALGTVLSDSQYRKVSIAADAGLDPEVWVAFREILPEFDSDSNGSYTQEEMEDAIRAFSSGTSYGSTLMKQGRNLSRDEMAILWQIGGNWKSANNPFSKPTGKKVKDLLDAEKKG